LMEQHEKKENDNRGPTLADDLFRREWIIR